MAAVLKTTTPFRAPIPPRSTTASLKNSGPICLSFNPQRIRCVKPLFLARGRGCCSLRNVKLVRFASPEGQTQTTETEEELPEPVIEDSSDGDAGIDDDANEAGTTEEIPPSAITASLQSLKEALVSNDESKVSEIEAFLKSIGDEKIVQENKVITLSEELSVAKDRILRISADFDNFRKRTERDRQSLVTNAQGEVVENLLPVLDNFERAKAQIKIETEGEEKISNSYQSIYKQFVEILGSLGVVPAETIGKPFDPLLHEAIMREESVQYEEGIVIEEFRKGFKLGDRLLRPSMVKVSAGPGPTKREEDDIVEAEEQVARAEESETAENVTTEEESS